MNSEPLAGHPSCPVRGHNHAVRLVRTLTQDITGLGADLFECPSGNYRWLVLKGHRLSDLTRMVKPRFGWRNPSTWRLK